MKIKECLIYLCVSKVACVGDTTSIKRWHVC